MGVCIHLALSDSITEQEWKSAYEESLVLAKAFRLGEIRTVSYRGAEGLCMVPAEEQTEGGWSGWQASGDCGTLLTGEDFRMDKNLLAGSGEKEATDAIMGILPAYTAMPWEDGRCAGVRSIWGSKTQGEPYHMYILAIACMMETRLGRKACVYGDITAGQCRRAAELASSHLDKAVEVPERCDMEKLFGRVMSLPLDGKEKVDAFISVYLGTKDPAFGEFLRRHFPAEDLGAYWEENIPRYRMDMAGYGRMFKEYLLWGFGIGTLCRLTDTSDRDGNPQYGRLVEKIMEAGLHLKEKDTEDPVDIDQEGEGAYGVGTLMAQFFLAGAHNPRVDRYVPLDELREILRNELGSRCDVDGIIDGFLEKESGGGESGGTAISRKVGQLKKSFARKTEEDREKYDIADMEDVLYYERGDSIKPAVRKALAESFKVYRGATDENRFRELMEKGTPGDRIGFLLEQNESVLLARSDWQEIFKEVEEDDGAFARYYPMVRLVLERKAHVLMVTAFVTNDALYEFLCAEAEGNDGSDAPSG